MYTSIPFLYDDGKVKNCHWKATFNSTSLACGQPDLWLYSGLCTFVPDDVFNQPLTLAERERVSNNFYSTPETYKSGPKLGKNKD